MRPSAEVVSINPHNYSLLIRTYLLVVAIRLGLWLLPFRWMLCIPRLLARQQIQLQISRQVFEDRVAWAVAATSRCVPAATCLTQALAVQAILNRYGCASELHIGVAKSAQGKLEGHAWVESNGRIIIGGPAINVARFVALPLVEQRPR